MKRIMINELNENIEKKVKVQGWLHKIRKLKYVTFIMIRDRSGLVQCVFENALLSNIELKLESVISIEGKVVEGKNSLSNIEIQGEIIEVINLVNEELSIEINKEKLDVNLDTMLNNRVLSLRHKKVNAIFKIQNIIVDSFREFLKEKDFQEIFTPKIVAEGAEGGTELFEVKYFENKAYLAQSPQFYKQMMVAAGFERVFEVGQVYRAEEHNTNRHLNEYVSMDLEMGFINDENDIMILEEELLKYILSNVNIKGQKYLEILEASVPIIETHIPRIKLSEAIEILEVEYNKSGLQGDLDPEGEKLIYKYVKEKYDSDFVFLTHYPRKKRPMYTMPCGEKETHSFDLLFRGVEITTGGQRIHDYEKLIENMEWKGLNPQNYTGYTEVFKLGMPKHGGLAIGLERITAQLLGIENIRETTLITRDRTRLTP